MREEENESEEGAVEDDYGSDEIAALARLVVRLVALVRSAREKNSNAERKYEIKEKENIGVKYEKENPVNKQIIKKFGIAVCTVLYLRRYCSMFQIFETFRIADEV